MSRQVNCDPTDIVREHGKNRPPLAGAAADTMKAKSVQAWHRTPWVGLSTIGELTEPGHGAASTDGAEARTAGAHGAGSGPPLRRSTAAEWMPPNPLAVTRAVVTSHNRDRFGT